MGSASAFALSATGAAVGPKTLRRHSVLQAVHGLARELPAQLILLIAVRIFIDRLFLLFIRLSVVRRASAAGSPTC